MKNSIFLVLFLALGLVACAPATDTEEKSTEETNTESAPMPEPEKAAYAIVIHGGAGTIRREDLSAEKEASIRSTLNEALDIGEAILEAGGSAMEAVEKTIHRLEDSPYFNAGKGAVFTNAGINELDASIMNGADRNAGAVGGVTNLKHPISAARAVLEKSEHVMLTGKGAEQFAEEQGLETVDPSYFHTDFRWEALQKAKAAEDQGTSSLDQLDLDRKYGTVGCVALDKEGNIVAGTSTGGMTNKRYNRIGDSPIIGAGTFADNKTCGVSSTGHGEFFIRWAVAYDISAIMEYQNKSLAEASDYVINKKLKQAGGTGGIIALDRYGNVSMPFNTAGMYRGYAKPGERAVKIYKE